MLMFGFMNQLPTIITFLDFLLLLLWLRFVCSLFGHHLSGKIYFPIKIINFCCNDFHNRSFYKFCRQGVYYLSLAAAGFLVFIMALAVIRLVVFCIIWGLTFGRHHLWLLPNLTEDVGFFASFWPLYKVWPLILKGQLITCSEGFFNLVLKKHRLVLFGSMSITEEISRIRTRMRIRRTIRMIRKRGMIKNHCTCK